MDDSAVNNLFNDPITGAGKNEDFLAEISAPEMGQRVEKSAITEGRGKEVHRARSHEKAEKSGRNRGAEHPAADEPKAASKLHGTRGELADITKSEKAEEASKEGYQAFEDARTARELLRRIAETTIKLRKRGGELLVKRLLPGAVLFTLAATSVYIDRTGSGLAQMLVSGIPEAVQGAFTSAIDPEARPVSRFRERRAIGDEEEDDENGEDVAKVEHKGEEIQLPLEAEKHKDKKRNIDPIQVADHITAAALAAAGSIITSKIAPEAQQFLNPAELALEAANAVDHMTHKYVEGPALKAIKKIKERSGTQAALNAAGVVEPIKGRQKSGSNSEKSELTDAESTPRKPRLPTLIRSRVRRRVEKSTSGGSSRPETPRSSVGPGNTRDTDNYRTRRTARRQEAIRERKGKTTSKSESPVMAH